MKALKKRKNTNAWFNPFVDKEELEKATIVLQKMKQLEAEKCKCKKHTNTLEISSNKKENIEKYINHISKYSFKS